MAFFPALIGISPGLRVLVAGGTGTVGSGVVLSLLREGAKVLVATRSLEKFEALKKSAPYDVRNNLDVAWGDISTEEGVKNVFERAAKQDGGVQHVVASIGSWWQKGRLIDQPIQEFNKTLKDRVVGHFLLFRTFIPYLDGREGSTYTMVTCNAGHEYLAPHTSMMSVGSGALQGLAVAARAEYVDHRVAVSEFNINCIVHAMPEIEMDMCDPYNVGNDLMGAAITASIAYQSRGKIVVRNKQDAKKIILVK